MCVSAVCEGVGECLRVCCLCEWGFVLLFALFTVGKHILG